MKLGINVTPKTTRTLGESHACVRIGHREEQAVVKYSQSWTDNQAV